MYANNTCVLLSANIRCNILFGKKFKRIRFSFCTSTCSIYVGIAMEDPPYNHIQLCNFAATAIVTHILTQHRTTAKRNIGTRK